MVSEKDLFIKMYEQEHATTVKVMKCYPEAKLDLKPGAKSMSARDLLWLFASEESVLLNGILLGKIEFAGMKPAPGTVHEILDAFEQGHKKNLELLHGLDEADLKADIDFFVAPKTPGKVPRGVLLWMMLHDQVHHRGQLSVYLRVAGAKVPSIYGPSADEPWM